MRSAILFLSFVPFTQLTTGCASRTDEPARSAASDRAVARHDEETIRARLADWVDATNAGDFARAATIWAPDMVGWYPGAPDDTYAIEMEALKKLPPSNAPRSRYALTIEEVIVSGDLAVVRDRWSEKASDKENVFRSFEVWRRQKNGEWKIARWIDAVP